MIAVALVAAGVAKTCGDAAGGNLIESVGFNRRDIRSPCKMWALSWSAASLRRRVVSCRNTRGPILVEGATRPYATL